MEILAPIDDRLGSWLARYQMDLEKGRTPSKPSEAGFPPRFKNRIHRAVECLHRLERATAPRRRRSPVAGAPRRFQARCLNDTVAMGPGVPPSDADLSYWLDSPVFLPFGSLNAQDASVTAAWEPEARRSEAHPADGLDLPTILSNAGFEAMEEIGRGGEGVVYRAVDLHAGREVAVKVLSPALAADPTRLHRFRHQAMVLAALNSRHILPILSLRVNEGRPILVMPLVGGTDLGRIISDRRSFLERGRVVHGVPWTASGDHEYLRCLLPLLDQLMEALGELHQGEVLHRDIKPSNVLVDADGTIRLSDFGLARLAGLSVDGLYDRDLGTPGYMSPEQWGRRPDIDGRADVFGVGATLYQALTLELPFGRSPVRSSTAPPPAPSARRPALPAGLDEVVMRAVQPDRRDRHASAAEFRDAWRRARSI